MPELSNNNSIMRPNVIATSGSSMAILPTSEERTRTKRIDEHLTSINKLQFSSLGLCGRDKETELLDSLLTKGGRNLAMIKGISGSGKTALAEYLKHPARNGHYVQGKFDYQKRNEPYSGIAAPFCYSFRRILKNPEFRSNLFKELKPELHVLAKLVPELKDVLLEENDGTNQNPPLEDGSSKTLQRAGTSKWNLGGDTAMDNSKARLLYAFKSFMSFVTTCFQPYVVVLDDLQWADSSTLELVQCILLNEACNDILVVGIYRSNEVDKTHILAKTIQDLKNAQQSGADFSLTEIEIGNLGLKEVNQVIMDLLSIGDESKTMDLAEVCYKRTEGNPNFLIAFVTMLQQEGFLEFNIGLLQWRWDDQAIETNTMATDNVVDILKRKMMKLSREIGQLLNVAAHLGAAFDAATLEIAWASVREKQSGEQVDNTTETLLGSAVRERFVEKREATIYGWVHDKVQEAASSLTDQEKAYRLKPRIGWTLVNDLNQSDLEKSIFVVVNLLQEASDSYDDSQRLRLAELNLQASLKSVELAAFASAAAYANNGIELLPTDRWTRALELAVELYSIAAESELAQGEVQSMKRHCNEIVEQPDIPVLSKVRAYNVLIDSAMNFGESQQVKKLFCDVLSQLNCRFPKRQLMTRAAAHVAVAKTKKLLKSRTKQGISKLPMMEDARQQRTVQLLDRLCTWCFMTGDRELNVLTNCRTIEITLKHGLCGQTPASFATFAFILRHDMGHFELAEEVADESLALLDRLDSRYWVSRTYLMVYLFIKPWTNSIHSSLSPFLEGYQLGLLSGDTESAMWCINDYMGFRFLCGRSLELLEADYRTYVQQMKDLKRHLCAVSTSVCWQVVLNLMGRSNNTTKIEGEVLPDLKAVITNEQTLTVVSVKVLQSWLYAIFGEYERGASLGMSDTDFVEEKFIGNPWLMGFLFTQGLSLLAVARKKLRPKYVYRANKIRLQIKDWIKQGNPNVRPYDKLLDAEFNALQGNRKSARTCYQEAVIVSSRMGLLQVAGLASERCADFALCDMRDQDEGVFRLKDAVKFYTEWGARKKVEQIREEYSNLNIG